MQNRDRSEIIRQMLDIANGGANKIQIMYRSFISHSQLKEYLAILTERDLLSYDSITKTYKTTGKGMRLLQLYNQLDDLIMKGSQHQ